ncbi:MAG: XylR family transcriptional regulator [Candidatus Cryptobacteroides sp.]
MARIILMTDFSEAYARNLLLGIARYTHEVGEAWSICRLPTSLRDKFGIEYVVDYACKIKADAIIGQFYETDDISLFKKNGIIAFAQDFKTKFSIIPNITGEYFLSGKIAAEYFLKKGFRNFAFYGISDVIWSEGRYEGFRQTIEAANQNYFISSLMRPKTDLWKYDFDELTTWLKSLPKPIAIMACDDNQAYSITEACHLLKMKKEDEISIPENIAVLGVDDDETICNLCSPNLSSVSQDVESGGYDVAQTIDRMLREKSFCADDIIVRSTHIVTRQSSDIFVSEDKIIVRVLKFIHENITHKISVEDILQEVPMSRRLLEKKFRKTMGTSIYDYIIRVRVDRLAHILSLGGTVSEASFELGQADIKNISRIFKRIKGVTPSEYRKKKMSKVIADKS